MTSTRVLVAGLTALLCTTIAVPARADVTLKSQSTGKGMMGGAMSGDQTQYVKGTRTRSDRTAGGKQTSTIIDASARQMIVLDHDKKQAEVIDMTTIGDSMTKAGVTDINVSITPTGQTRQVAGSACTVYDVKVSVPMMANSGMTMTMAGPQCLAKNAPGHADFAAFFKAASEKGFFLDPQQAKAQPAAAKAMADMQRKMAELGVPLATEMNITMGGDGPMAEMMKKMGSTVTTEVTAISTAAIPDSMFEVPAGYKVSKR